MISLTSLTRQAYTQQLSPAYWAVLQNAPELERLRAAGATLRYLRGTCAALGIKPVSPLRSLPPPHKNMLARLQQAITLGSLGFALVFAFFAYRTGHPRWAPMGAILLVTAYALVMALEFLLVRLAHGDDPTSRATAGRLLKAWWQEIISAPQVFCWRQPFASQRWPDLLPANAQGRRGVLLIHGFVCNRGIWNRWLQRLTAMDVPTVAVNLSPIFASLDDYATLIEDAVQRLERCTGLAPIVVAHSMGGLALRRWWADAEQILRVHHAITIATPHRGTLLARLGLAANARQMARDSPWLAALASRESREVAQRCICFYSQCDNMVLPPAAAAWPGADNRHLPGVAHVHMVDHPAPWQALMGLLGTGIKR